MYPWGHCFNLEWTTCVSYVALWNQPHHPSNVCQIMPTIIYYPFMDIIVIHIFSFNKSCHCISCSFVCCAATALCHFCLNHHPFKSSAFLNYMKNVPSATSIFVVSISVIWYNAFMIVLYMSWLIDVRNRKASFLMFMRRESLFFSWSRLRRNHGFFSHSPPLPVWYSVFYL